MVNQLKARSFRGKTLEHCHNRGFLRFATLWTLFMVGVLSAQVQITAQQDDPFPSPFSSQLIDQIKALKARTNQVNPSNAFTFNDRTARIIDDASSHSNSNFRRSNAGGPVPAVAVPEARDFFSTGEGSDNADNGDDSGNSFTDGKSSLKDIHLKILISLGIQKFKQKFKMIQFNQPLKFLIIQYLEHSK